MSTTFYQLWNNLIGEVGADLPQPRAKQLINDAWRDIQNKRPWSFLLREGMIQVPAVITGNIAVTQYSATAVPSAALKTILDALSSPPLLTRRSLRAAATGGVIGGNLPIYDIYGYDPSGAGAITLDRQFQEATSAVLSVNIYRRWILPPLDPTTGFESTNFLRWLTVKDPDNNFWLDISKPKRYLDMVDPNRTSTGMPFMLVQAPAATTVYPGVTLDGNLQPGTPLYELYPHYVSTPAKVYYAVYQAYGAEFTDDLGRVNSVLPPYINSEMLFDYARMKAYRWAEINKGRIPSLVKTNWLLLIQEARNSYDEQYLAAQRIDREIYNQEWIPRLGQYYRNGFLGGADYWQTHSSGGFPWMGGL